MKLRTLVVSLAMCAVWAAALIGHARVAAETGAERETAVKVLGSDLPRNGVMRTLAKCGLGGPVAAVMLR